MKSLRKKMSKQIQDDKCHNVSSMTVEGIRKMLLIQKMTLRQNVKKSLSQATKTEKTVTPLYIYVGYRYSLLNTSCLSRLGRSLLEVMRILETCLSKNCQVWTLKENYRLGNDIQSKVLAFAFGLAAEIERNLISQRTKSSLANLKASGKTLGRPFSAESKKLKLSKNAKKVQNLLAKGISKSQIAKILGVQRSTLRRFIERML